MSRLGRSIARKFTVQPKVVISAAVTPAAANTSGQTPDATTSSVEAYTPPPIRSVTWGTIVRSHYW